MKKAIMYIIIFCFLCFISEQGINYSLGNQIKNQSPFYLSFSSIGANLLESRMDSWAKINLTYTSKELDENLIHILEHLQLPIDRYKFVHKHHDYANELQYNCQKNDISYSFSLQSDKGLKETYYLITVTTGEKKDRELKNIQITLQKLMNFRCYYLYTGEINNIYDITSQKRLLSSVMKELNARKIEEYHDDQVISMTGFSRALGLGIQPVKGMEKRYNLQVAIRSNNQLSTTTVYIGTPLILGNY